VFEYDREASIMRRPWPTGGGGLLRHGKGGIELGTFRHGVKCSLKLILCLAKELTLVKWRRQINETSRLPSDVERGQLCRTVTGYTSL
jgi:hypothetical protein